MQQQEQRQKANAVDAEGAVERSGSRRGGAYGWTDGGGARML